MIKMFVGSSTKSEDLAIQISKKIESRLEGVIAHHWRRTLVPGKYSLSSIMHEIDQCQLAMFLFAADDVLDVDDKKVPAPRDNVILEAGLCLAKLGPRRVALVLENGVKCPTDLSGLICAPFARCSDEDAANEVVGHLVQAWSSIRDPSPLGIEQALRATRASARDQIESLYFPPAGDRPPVILDSQPCVDAYVGGLETVSERFWTTTYLTSGFWTGSAVSNLLRVNRNMLGRLAAKGPGAARRAFITPLPPEQYIISRKADIRKFRQADEAAEVNTVLTDISNLRKNVEQMNKHGFETRIVHDQAYKSWRELNNTLRVHHESGDTEIAIYDEKRVDLYTGGRHGVIDQVTCTFEGTSRFDQILSASETYFEHLWNGGEEAVEYLRQCEDAVYRAAAEIDYTPNWLARYDYKLSTEDERLKHDELELSAQLVGKCFGRRKPRRYLDVGSCTARYPIHLLRAKLLASTTTIIPLENDDDALVVMQAKLEAEGVPIKAYPGDFMSWGPNSPRDFDLITCMLGTLSHLAAPGPEGDSQLLRAISKLGDSLSPEGFLLLGCWSDEAIRDRKFLGIYTKHDKALLSKWSPARSDIEEALGKAGLRFSPVSFSARMDLYLCAHVGNSRFPLAV